MKNYVISLPNATLRREHIRKEFTEKGVAFEFFDAFSPSERMDKTILELIPALAENTTLTNGEKGCLLSHLALWKKCVDEDLDYIAIFEDDVILSPHSNDFLQNDRWLNDYFNKNTPFIIRCETYKMPVKLTTHKNIYNREISQLHSKHWGTASYIINKTGANFLSELFYTAVYDKIQPIDKILFEELILEKKIAVYQLSPSIVIQDIIYHKKNSTLKSTIEDRTSHSKRIKKSILNSVKREIYRTYRRINQKLNNFKIVDFS